MSNIGDYQALVAALSVSFTQQDGRARTITAKNVKDLENVVQSSGTPVRMLVPFAVGPGDNISAEMFEFNPGNTSVVRWTFSDVMLWRPAPFGKGLGDSAYDLREYVSAYMTAGLSLDASSISDRMEVENLNVQVYDLLNFPEGSKYLFIGAVATWTVKEDDPLE